MPELTSRLPALLEPKGFNQMVRGRHGYLLFNTNDVYVGRAIGLYGEYGEIESQAFQALCHAGDVVVEVGANIGSETVALARFVGPAGHVYAFEPQRIVFQNLCANMALNSLTNVSCFHAAVGDASGSIRMPDLDYSRENNFGGVSAGTERGYNVPLVRLDDFLEIDRLRLLKVDVEGMESKVLAGARELITRFRPILYVENDRVEKSEALIRQIQALEYRMFWHAPPLFNPNNFAGEPTNIWPNVVSFNMLCVPREADTEIRGLPAVDDPTFHPLRR